MTDKPDPRYAADLREAAQNDDGSYSLPRAMAWLSEAMNPGKGITEGEVREIIEQVKLRRTAQVKSELKAHDHAGA